MNLILSFSSTSDAVDYIIGENGTVAVSGNCLLNDLGEIISAHDCKTLLLLVPGEKVSNFLVTLPKGSTREIAKALPFIVEEKLASPIEDVHLTRIDRPQGEPCMVLAIAKSYLESLLEQTHSLGIPVLAAYPDYLALQPGDQPRGVRIGDRVIVRLPDGSGYTLADSEQNQSLVPVTTCWHDSATFGQSLVDLAEPTSGNLLHGVYSRLQNRNSNWKTSLNYGLAASLLVFSSYFLAAGWYFNDQAQQLQREAESLYRTVFPQDKRIVNPRSQMEGHLARSRTATANHSFVSLLSAFADSLSTLPPQSTSPRLVQFDGKNDSLTIEIQAATVNDTGVIQKHLGGNHYNMQVLSITKNDSGMLARLEIKPQ